MAETASMSTATRKRASLLCNESGQRGRGKTRKTASSSSNNDAIAAAAVAANEQPTTSSAESKPPSLLFELNAGSVLAVNSDGTPLVDGAEQQKLVELNVAPPTPELSAGNSNSGVDTVPSAGGDEASSEKQQEAGGSQDDDDVEVTSVRINGMLSDCIIKVGERSFYAQRQCLVAVSPFFRAMFSSGFSEAQSGVVTLKNMDATLFSRIFQWIPGHGTPAFETHEDTLWQMFKQIDYLQFGFIRDGYEAHWLHNFETNKWAFYLALASHYAMTRLLEKCQHTFVMALIHGSVQPQPYQNGMATVPYTRLLAQRWLRHATAEVRGAIFDAVCERERLRQIDVRHMPNGDLMVANMGDTQVRITYKDDAQQSKELMLLPNRFISGRILAPIVAWPADKARLVGELEVLHYELSALGPGAAGPSTSSAAGVAAPPAQYNMMVQQHQQSSRST